MGKIHIQNLGMIITEKCNLNCGHCLRGKCGEKDMRDDVIEATLEQVESIDNLGITGGEILLALDKLEKIFTYVVEHKISVREITLTINGTIYDDEFLRLLDYVNSYISFKTSNEIVATFGISYDKYHISEIKRLNLVNQFVENLEKYEKSKHYVALFGLEEAKLFREGNALNLDPKLTVPLRPITPIITYAGKRKKLDIKNGKCNIGPIVAVNVNGTITECDASIEHQETIYNYGNILEDSIEDVVLSRNPHILNPPQWLRQTKKLVKKYTTYKK